MKFWIHEPSPYLNLAGIQKLPPFKNNVFVFFKFRWLGIRLEVLSNLIVFFAALLAVVNRDTMSAAIAGLSITYSMNVSHLIERIFFFAIRISNNVKNCRKNIQYEIERFTLYKEKSYLYKKFMAPDA